MSTRDPRIPARLVAVAVLLSGIACGDETGSDATPDRVSAVIGPEGGLLALEGDGPLAGTRLEIPPGALDAPSTVVLEATLDPTPLATKAERIGPQVRMSPEGLALAKPATLTLPLDPEVVELYGQSPADCRVWQRDGEGWKRIEQVASTDRTVTVPIDALRTAAAGLLVKPKTTTCSLTSLSCILASQACSDPTGFCLRRLAAAPVPAHPANMMAAGSRLFYDTVPAANRIGITRYELDGDTVTNFRPLVNVTRNAVGQPALEASGRAWLAVPGLANVAFSSGPDPVLFDTPNAERVGSVVEVDGTIHRLARPVVFSSTAVRICWLSPGSACVTIGNVRAAVGVRARLGSAAPNKFMAFDNTGMTNFSNTVSAASLLVVEALGTESIRLRDARPSATDDSVGVLAQLEDRNGQFAWVQRPGADGTPCDLTNFTQGALAVDADQTVWFPSLDSPELASCSPEGGLSFLQLTTAAPGTEEYDRMIPRAIVAVPSRNRLVVATRGTNGTELYELRRAQ